MIPEFPPVIAAELSDIIYAVQGYVSPLSPGESVRETLQQVYNLIQEKVVLFYPGDPNGSLAGIVKQFCLDTANYDLFLCISTGSASTAIWAEVANDSFATKGTNNQVLVNGTYGIPITASLITLTTPQDIAPSSSPTFAAITAGNFHISGNEISSINTDGNIDLIPNGDGYVLIGSSVPWQVFNDGSYCQIGGDSRPGYCDLLAYEDSDVGSQLGFLKSRGEVVGGPHSVVQSGDILGGIAFAGDNGTSFGNAGSIRVSVPESVSGEVVSGFMIFSTSSSSSTLIDAMTIDQNQDLSLTNPLKTGSGGLGINTTPANGQIPIGNGTNYVAANIIEGSGINIVNGPGTLEISSLIWNNITATSASMVSNNGYKANNVALVTLALPVASVFGDVIEICGFASGGWAISQGAGQKIIIGSSSSTIGAGGSVSSSHYTASGKLVCMEDNLTWQCVGSFQGPLTII